MAGDPDPIAELRQSMESAFEAWTRSPAVQRMIEEIAHPVVVCDFKRVKPDAKIEVAGFDEPIDLLHLRRTIGNAAINLLILRGWFEQGEPTVGRKAAINYLIRTQQSMRALAELLKSDKIPSPFHDALRTPIQYSDRPEQSTIAEDEEITGASRQPIFHCDPGTRELRYALKLANVYARLKKLQRRDIEVSGLHSEIASILLYISLDEETTE